MKKYSLVLNPGSTSMKLGVYCGRDAVFTESISHSQGDLARFSSVVAQKDYRRTLVDHCLKAHNIAKESLAAVISIGGMMRAGRGGVYQVNEGMVADLSVARYQEHASNLGALIGWDLANTLGIPAYVGDPITTDEMQEVARISGMPEIRRKGRSHALNQKSVAARAARELGLPYEEARLIVAHLGGGISVVAHRDGLMVDTNAARGEGPFCIDRTGGVNTYEVVKLALSGKFSKEEMLGKISGNGGVVAYLGTRDFREVTARRAAGDEKACAVFDAMAYQIAKEIGAMSIPLLGQVDAIVLTGGMAHSSELTEAISRQVAYLGRVMVYPGENELQALADYLDEVLHDSREVQIYYQEEA